MEIGDVTRMSMLYDFYGTMLSGKQRDIFKLYHEDNYSLGEIAEEMEISRQGVHEAVKKAETTLTDCERRLGLLQKYEVQQKITGRAKKELNALKEDYADDGVLAARLEMIANMMDTGDF